ncbi:Calmodulin-binding transcription activator 4 [Raphanus sativus]|nr:Calmodulin-binding transcription activator 4 [Raphanus sativus]
MQSQYDVTTLYQEGQTRWLKPPEVHFILLNHERYQLTDKPPHKPSNMQGVSDMLKALNNLVGNAEALQCYYAHGEHEPSFQRRIYWILDPEYEHIALVHYRDVSDVKEVKQTGGTVLQFSLNPSTLFTSPGYSSHCIGVSSDIRHQQHSSTSAAGNVEVNSNSNGGVETRKGSGRSSYEREALKRLEEQLSLGDDDDNVVQNESLDSLQFLDIEHLVPPAIVHQRPETSSKLGRCYGGSVGPQYNTVGPLYYHKESLESLLSSECSEDTNHLAQPAAGHQRPESNRLERCLGGHIGADYHSNNLMLVKNDSDGSGGSGDQKPKYWKDVLEACDSSIALTSEGSTPSSAKGLLAGMQEDSNWSYSNQADQATLLLPQELGSCFELPTCYSELRARENNADNSRMKQPFEQVMSQTVAYKQKFTIQDISPEWGYANETTKVIIVGSFLCDPKQSTWSCMFGSTEAPFEIIKEGVLRCQAPPCGPGKVNLCITSGDGLSCSQTKEFEYHDKPDTSSFPKCSRDELLLLVRLVQTLVSDSKSNLEPWSHILETVLDGTATSSSTVDWLLRELLKDKLDAWLSSRTRQDEEDQPSCCSLSKQEQGIIHMVSGLGFEWALHIILACGVSVDFRDINGWSALHWAARFGSEKMVAALIASGASAGAVTDPTAQDPAGKTAASIAASNGHKGLAGYLSEVALTNHLSSLTLEETEKSKETAQLQAEMTLNSISKRSPYSLKDTLAAVRNAAQAAARIQAAFRAHSFRKRQQREAAAYFREYGIYADIKGISAMSKLAFGNVKNYHSAALSIQKNYRRYKRRKEFLSLRKKVVKIQAHVRGYQIRKHYKVICWAVGILDKVVLRWRRKGAGLRGFRQDVEDSEEEEDILKVFRKQKVDVAVNEAFSRVLSMANSPEARQQYHRVLKRYCQTKAELGKTESLGAGGDEDDDLFDLADMEDDSLFAL